MSEVQRFEPYIRAEMLPDGVWGTAYSAQMNPNPAGRYVKAEDYDALSARCAELERDAARYRWIRSQGSSWETEAFIMGLSPEQYDAAIDSAMSTEAVGAGK